MANFLGTINRGSKIPISLALDVTPTGTPTYRILNAARAEIVAATNLSGSGLLWYKDDQTVASGASEGEYQIEYSAVISGTTRYDYDTYEVPQASLTPSSGISLSGNSNWTRTMSKIIKRALQISGAIGEDGEPNANQTAIASDILNGFVKWLQVVHKVKIWKLVWDYKKFSAPSEVTGPDSNIYTCILSHVSSSASKPVTGDDWTSYWILKGTTGGVWADSTAYSSSGDFVDGTDLIGVEEAFLRRKSSTGPHSDSPIEIIGNSEYASLADKTSFGDPIRLFFNQMLTSPTIFVYPLVEDTDDLVIHYQKMMRIEDFDAAGNTPDFPVHWIDPLTMKLAHRLSIEYKAPISEQRELKKEATELINGVLFGTDNRSQRVRISHNYK
jgi:hypothetical protein